MPLRSFVTLMTSRAQTTIHSVTPAVVEDGDVESGDDEGVVMTCGTCAMRAVRLAARSGLKVEHDGAPSAPGLPSGDQGGEGVNLL